MKSFAAVLFMVTFASSAQAACPALQGNYSSCSTVYEGSTTQTGGVNITQSKNAAGHDTYHLDISQSDGTSGTRDLVADGHPYTSKLVDNSVADAPSDVTTTTAASCPEDGVFNYSDDVVRTWPTRPDLGTGEFTESAEYSKDTSGLHVVTTYRFSSGTMVFNSTCR